MTREEYLKKVIDQNINLESLGIIIDRKSNMPSVMGCFKEDEIWKMYSINERQKLRIVQEGTEDQIFDRMWRITEGIVEEYKLGYYKP